MLLPLVAALGPLEGAYAASGNTAKINPTKRSSIAWYCPWVCTST